MAQSGIINGSCTGEYGKRYNFWIEWRVNSQSIAENKSNVTVVCKVKRNVSWVYGYNLDRYPSTVLKIDGTQVALTARSHIDTRDGKTSAFATWTGDVTHRTDGTLTLLVECSWTLTGVSSLTGGQAHGSALIDALPRMAVPVLSQSVSYLGEPLGITLTGGDPSYTSTLEWSFMGQSGDIPLTSETAAEWTPPLDLAELIPSVSDAPALITCSTYDGDELIGTAYAYLTLVVPENTDTKPTLAVTLSPVNGLSGDAANYYITGFTRVRADFTGSGGKYGAEIASGSLTVDGVTVTGGGTLLSVPITSQDESIEVTYSVTDSRGFSTSGTAELTLIPYSAPKIIPNGSEVFAVRSDSEGNPSRIGTYLKIMAATKYSPCPADGDDLNSCVLSVSYRRADDTEWSAWSDFSDVTVSEVVSGVTLTPSDAYEVRLRALDEFGKYFIYNASVPASTVTFHMKHGGNGAAFGKYAEEDGVLDSAWLFRSRGGSVDVFPATRSGSCLTLTRGTLGDIADSFAVGNAVLIRCGTRVYFVVSAEHTSALVTVEALGLENGSVTCLAASAAPTSVELTA